ncbi:SMI1/KNR4 family protein [Domibacillus indicus]|uniref:SMI1/KNR4 family protein n=1 Tax=Domibacillus indicus TaxID=1437523 RepID=UPI00203BD2F1|nr:SMI1/KNR4 family protein [Domibacillus indicus]MCM3789328.1 SMI1/KNR4 family protein [Domibacillus indicus]
MWKNYIETISKNYYFTAPASNSEMTLVKEKLNVELPLNLIKLFNETNGAFDEHGYPLIWSTGQIVEDNLFFRGFEDYKDIYMPFDHLLFFSGAGNGDLFCFAILNENIQKDDIYVWNHEDDSRIEVASSLEDFVKGWITGEISV